jgi:hypothetical protein
LVVDILPEIRNPTRKIGKPGCRRCGTSGMGEDAHACINRGAGPPRTWFGVPLQLVGSMKMEVPMKRGLVVLTAVGLLLGTQTTLGQWKCEEFEEAMREMRSQPLLQSLLARVEVLEVKVERLEALQRQRDRLERLEERIERLESRTESISPQQ